MVTNFESKSDFYIMNITISDLSIPKNRNNKDVTCSNPKGKCLAQNINLTFSVIFTRIISYFNSLNMFYQLLMLQISQRRGVEDNFSPTTQKGRKILNVEVYCQKLIHVSSMMYDSEN